MALKDNWFLYFAALSVNFYTMASFVGLTWSMPVLSKLNGDIEGYNPLPSTITKVEESLLSSLGTLGVIVGAVPVGTIADKIGRKYTLIGYSIIILICNTGLAFANSIELMLALRFFQALGCASSLVLVPMYSSEIAKTDNRGLITSGFTIFAGAGTLLASIGTFLSIKVFSLVSNIPIVLFLLAFGVFIPDSPYYYSAKKNHAKVEEVLSKLRRNESREKIKTEAEEIERYTELSQKESSVSILDLLRSKQILKVLFLLLGINCLSRVGGNSAIASYMQPIFEDSGSDFPSDLSSAIVGIVQFVITLLSASLVDRLGRKILLMVSTVGCTIFLACLGLYFTLKELDYNMDSYGWLPVSSVTLNIISYSIGLMPVLPILTSEFFPPKYKAVGASVVIFVFMIAELVVVAAFPSMEDSIGAGLCMWIFTVFSFISIFYVYFLIPETKGKNFEEIQVILKVSDDNSL